ncbi:hypothetical protein Tco_0325339, partial [Tanacetum coccineum]
AIRNVRLEDAQEVPLNDSITPADEGLQMKEKSDSGDVENALVKGSLSRNNVCVNVVNIGVDSGNEGPNKGLMEFGTDSSDSHNTLLVSPTLNTPSFADVLKDAGNSAGCWEFRRMVTSIVLLGLVFMLNLLIVMMDLLVINGYIFDLLLMRSG